MIPIRSHYALAQAGVARKIYNGNPVQAQCPRDEQMKAAIPREVIDTGGSFEEDNRRAAGLRLLASDSLCNGCDLEIIKPADESAFDSLGIEIL